MKFRWLPAAAFVCMCLIASSCGKSGTQETEQASFSETSSSEALSETGGVGADVSGAVSAEADRRGSGTDMEDDSVASGAGEEEREQAGRTSKVIEITMDNWDQYFEIVPLHSEATTSSNGIESLWYYNGFEFILKDEYMQDYLEHSGWYFDDGLRRQIVNGQMEAFENSAELSILEEEGRLYIPAGAEIRAYFRAVYDGESIWADYNTEYQEKMDYIQSKESVELDRSVTILQSRYLDFLINRVREEELGSDGTEEGGAVNAGSVDGIWDYYFGRHLGAHIFRGHVDYDDSTRTEDFLDRFDVTLRNISGTLTVWE